MNVQRRRASARQEILDATQLADVARRSIYGVPELFLARIEIAVARLALLERAESVEAPRFRPAGTIHFPEPLAAFEPSVRTQEQGRDPKRSLR